MVSSQKVPLDEVFAKIGLGWFHMRLWWICGFGFSAAAVEVVLMSFVFPELRRVSEDSSAIQGLTEYQLGSLATIVSCGSIFGELVFGALADRHGRRPIFMVTVFIVFFFGVASSFAPTVSWLAGLRLFVGVGYGGNIAVDFTLYSEFVPTLDRGRMMFLLTGFWPLGQIFACLLAWFMIPSFGWRAYVATCSVPMLMTALARPLIPESPRWLLTQGKVAEATEVCRDIAVQNGKTPEEIGLGDLHEVCLETESQLLDGVCIHDSKWPWEDIWSRHMFSTTIGLLILVSALNYVGYGIVTLMPSFLEMKGIPRSSVYISMLLNAVAQIPGVICATWTATNIGRLCPMRSSIFACGLCLFGFAFVQKQGQVLACTMLASMFLETGWALYHVYVPEVYPTECRAFATGFMSAAGSIVAMGGPLVSAFLLDSSKTPFQVIMAFSSCCLFAGFTSCLLLSIETKDRDLLDVSDGQRVAKVP